MDDAPRVVQKAHGANSGRVAPEPVPVIEARVVAVAPGPEPTLKEHCVFLKEQLGLEGRIPEVISGACRALGVEETGTLVDRARRCRAVVDGGSPAAGAAPSGERGRDGGAPPPREYVRDDSARKLQGLQRQRIARAKAREARAKAREARVLAIQQRGGVVVAQPGAAKYPEEAQAGAAKYDAGTAEEARASDSKGQQPSRDNEIGGALRVQGWWCVRRRRWTWEDLTFKRRFGPGVGICCCLGPGGALAVPLGPVCCYKLEARGRNRFVMYTICDKPGPKKDDYYSRSGADGVFKNNKSGATIVFHNDFCHSSRCHWGVGGPQGLCGGCLFLPCMFRMSTPRYDDW